MQKISASKIRIIRTCPLKYALTYGGDNLIGFKVPKVETDYNFYRNMACNAFSEFYKKNFKDENSFANWGHYQIKTHMKELEKNGKELVFANIENMKYIPRIREVMKKFYLENKDDERKNVEVNRHVNVLLVDGIYDIMLNSVIDFVRNGDEILVRDYKMGARKGDEFDIEKDVQLGVYSFLIEKTEKRRPVVESYIPGYDDVETSIVRKQFTNDDHERVKEIIIKTFEKMNELNIKLVEKQKIEPNYSEHCRFCNHTYSGACDKYTNEGWIDTFSNSALKVSLVDREKDETQRKSAKKRPRKDKNQYEMKFGKTGDAQAAVLEAEPSNGSNYTIEMPNIQLPEIQIPKLILPEIQMTEAQIPVTIEPTKKLAEPGQAIRFDDNGDIYYDQYRKNELDIAKEISYNRKINGVTELMKYTLFRI